VQEVVRALVAAVLDQPDRAAHADCLLALNQLFNPAVGLALFTLVIFCNKIFRGYPPGMDF
jgi:hypothetical protein